MKTVVLYKPGSPDNFIIENRPVPIPSAGQVLISVKAFGLNRSELMTRKGLSPSVTFPRVLGIECVGIVENDPSGELQKGQKVAASMGEMGRSFDGSYAEYTVLPREIITPFESTLPWDVLGALPEMFQTAYGSLHLALEIMPGDNILIRGGTSSVGLLAIHLAKKAGLKVYASTRNQKKKEFLLNNGADKVIIDDGNLAQIISKNNFQINKVLELVGTNTLPDSLNCVTQGGKVCMTGMLSEQWSIENFAPMDYIPSTVSLTTYNSGKIRLGAEAFQQFINSIQNGSVKILNHTVFKLDHISKAHYLMERNEANGKIVVLT